MVHASPKLPMMVRNALRRRSFAGSIGIAVLAALLTGGSFGLATESAYAQRPSLVGPGFLSVRTVTLPGDVTAVNGVKNVSGRVSVAVLDETRRDVTSLVTRQGDIRWHVQKEGARAAVTGSLEQGNYELHIGYGDNVFITPLRILPGMLTEVRLRPGVLRIDIADSGKTGKRARLIFTAAPDVSQEAFARDGCKLLEPNIAMIRAFRVSGSSTAIFLPPGLYRVISEYDQPLGWRTDRKFYVHLVAGQAISVQLDGTGTRAMPEADAPVFDGKCYF